MKCQQCKEEILTKMRFAIIQNVCPFCGKEIMPPVKLSQMRDLESVFETVKFTDRPIVDVKIKERVIAVILDNFDLQKIAVVNTEESVIKLNEKLDNEESVTVDVREEDLPIKRDRHTIASVEEIEASGESLIKNSKKIKTQDISPSVVPMPSVTTNDSLAEAKMRQEAHREALKDESLDIKDTFDNGGMVDIDDQDAELAQQLIGSMQSGNEAEFHKTAQTLKKIAPSQRGSNKSISRL